MNITIEIKYLGAFRDKTGIQDETLIVSEDLNKTYRSIMDHCKTQYGLVPPYILLMGNTHIARALKNPGMYPVNEGTSFTVLPVISGG